MGAGDASRSDVERRQPVRRSTRGVDQHGLRRRPKPGQSTCPWNAVAPIVADSARPRRASASARSRCWPAGSPFDPSWNTDQGV